MCTWVSDLDGVGAGGGGEGPLAPLVCVCVCVCAKHSLHHMSLRLSTLNEMLVKIRIL